MAPDDTPAIAVIPYAERLTEGLPNLPLDRLDWPLGRPARLAQLTLARCPLGDSVLLSCVAKAALHPPHIDTPTHYHKRVCVCVCVCVNMCECV